MRKQYEIQVATRHGWSADQIGSGNSFASVAEANRVIRDLKRLGGDWATAQYRVVEK